MKADEIEKRLKNALIYGTSHPEAYKTKADELWLKHMHNDMYATKAGFLAALTEYGESVRKQAFSVCMNEGAGLDNEWNRKLGVGNDLKEACEDCAAAIEKMELP